MSEQVQQDAPEGERAGTSTADLPGETPQGREVDLAAVVREVEAHAAGAGWDQPAALFALVETADLLRREPQLAEVLGLVSTEADAAGDPSGDPSSDGGRYTPVEQERIDGEVEDLLAEILWPAEVDGCAAVVERLVLPPEVDDEIPDSPAEAADYAASHPDRHEVRIVAGVLRTGESWCVLRLRSHDEDESVVGSRDLVPALLRLLHATFEPDARETDDE